MTPDVELLRQYAKSGDEAAFAELVRRQVNLVYSVALRLTGNAALAQDVAQTVFTDLARKAGPLSHHETLAGWLHTSTRFAALKALRGEMRRQTYEQEASTMQRDSTKADFDWAQLGPVLDEAVSRLRAHERDVVVLRFFSGLSHREIGAALGLNENTARKRVDHALEKLRSHFARSGITVSSALLATAITTNSVQAAPAEMAEKITGPSLAGAVGQTGGAGALFLLLRILIMSTKTKTMLTIATLAVLLVFTAGGIWWYTQSMPAPEKTAFAPASSKSAIDPKSPALHPPPSTPIVIPPKASELPRPQQVGTPLPADPQTDLKTALADMAHLLRTAGNEVFDKKYDPPAPPPPPPAPTIPGSREALVAQVQAKWMSTGVNTVPSASQVEEQIERDAKIYDSLIAQTPTFNTAGDKAIFKYIPQDGIYAQLITMIKINGKWYLDGTMSAPKNDPEIETLIRANLR